MLFAFQTRNGALAALVGALALTMPSVAAADPSTEIVDLPTAKALFKSAQADEQAGAWDSALVKLRRASSARMTPGIRFHIALCEEKTNHLVAALTDYVAAQAAARDANNREVLSLVSAPLLALKLRVPTVTIRLPGSVAPDAAEVRLDGVVVPSASLALAVPVEPGEHTLEATAPGRRPFTSRFTAHEQETQVIAIALVATEPAPPAPIALIPVPPAEPPPPVPTASSSHGLAILATVGAVVLVAGGVGAFAAAGSDQSYWDVQCNGRPMPCGNRVSVRTWDAVALGGWIAGAGAAGAAIFLWTRPAHPSSPSLGLRANPGAIWLSGSF